MSLEIVPPNHPLGRTFPPVGAHPPELRLKLLGTFLLSGNDLLFIFPIVVII
jgi:hypothetical protein